MKKWQIICPLAILALLLLPVLPRYISRVRMARRDAITWRAICAGRDLQAQTNSTLLVSIPPQLKQELTQFLTAPTAYSDTFRFGDEPAPLGDGTATHRVYLRNLEDQRMIALRLRYDPKLQKFHVLGFWHPDSWPDPDS